MTRKEVERALDYLFDDDYFVETCEAKTFERVAYSEDADVDFDEDGLQITLKQKFGKITFFVLYEKIKKIEREDYPYGFDKIYTIKTDSSWSFEIFVNGFWKSVYINFPEDEY